MRVSFFGKGGSGKTTLSISFIKYLREKGLNVLGIDADINVHLAKGLNMDKKELANSFDEIANFLEEKRILNGKNIIGSTPASSESKFIYPKMDDEFFEKFATKKDGVLLLTVGTYSSKSVGSDCYHSMLGNIILMYNRLLDDDNFFVVTDSTAGIDSVGTSMFSVSDINIFAVEPTKKSIEVYKDFVKITEKYGIKTYVIGNKIQDESDIDFITNEVGEKNVIGFVNYSKNLRDFEKGIQKGLVEFIKENDEINNKIYSLLLNTKKDWKKYKEISNNIYIGDANSWYSQYYNEDLTSYIDKNFDYEKEIEKYEISSKNK